MATLTELTAEIVSAHANGSSLTSEELLKNIQAVYSTLKALETGESVPSVESAPAETPEPPAMTVKQAFKKDEIICMICNKGGFKTLKLHLSKAHNLKPGEYRKQFGIPSTQSLAAKSYSESRRKMALDKGLGAGLVKFRADKNAKKAVAPAKTTKAPVPAAKVKAPTAAKPVKSPKRPK
jgi:predicted transcriptional regulator